MANLRKIDRTTLLRVAGVALVDTRTIRRYVETTKPVLASNAEHIRRALETFGVPDPRAPKGAAK